LTPASISEPRDHVGLPARALISRGSGSNGGVSLRDRGPACGEWETRLAPRSAAPRLTVRAPLRFCAVRLVKWQRNAIFEAVKAGGVDARECTFDYDDAGARITHVPSDSYFLIEGDPGHYVATAFVGEEQDPPSSSDAFTGPTVEERVETWSPQGQKRHRYSRPMG
jgi:hypothetical protein